MNKFYQQINSIRYGRQFVEGKVLTDDVHIFYEALDYADINHVFYVFDIKHFYCPFDNREKTEIYYKFYRALCNNLN